MSTYSTKHSRRAVLLGALATFLVPQRVLADSVRNDSGKPRTESDRLAVIEERRLALIRAREEYERETGKLAAERVRELDKADEEFWREIEQIEAEYDWDLAEGKSPDEAFEKYDEKTRKLEGKYSEKVEKIDARYYEKVLKEQFKVD